MSDNLNVPTRYLFILSDGTKKMNEQEEWYISKNNNYVSKEAHGISNANIPGISSSTSRHG